MLKSLFLKLLAILSFVAALFFFGVYIAGRITDSWVKKSCLIYVPFLIIAAIYFLIKGISESNRIASEAYEREQKREKLAARKKKVRRILYGESERFSVSRHLFDWNGSSDGPYDTSNGLGFYIFAFLFFCLIGLGLYLSFH